MSPEPLHSGSAGPRPALSPEIEAVLAATSSGVAFVAGECIEHCNARFGEILGRPGEHLGGQPVAALITGELEARSLIDACRTALAGEAAHASEHCLVRSDGSTLWCRLQVRALPPRQGLPRSLWLLEESGGRPEFPAGPEDLIEQLGTGIALLRQRRILRCNRSFCELFGYTRDELEGQSTRILHPGEEAWLDAGRQAYGLGNSSSFDGIVAQRRKDGTQLSCQVSGRRLRGKGSDALWLWTYRDVTGESEIQSALVRAKGELEERIRRRTADLASANAALRDQLGFIEQLIDAMPNPVYFKDTEGRYLGCNRAFVEFIGFPREQLIGKTVREIAPPELAEVYHAADLKLLENPGAQSYDALVRYADGSIREVAFYKATFHHLDGKLAGLVGAMLDITERKQAEAALREQSERLRVYFDLPMIGMARLGLQDGWLEINDKLCEIVGYSAEELAGLAWIELVHPDDSPAETRRFTDALSGASNGHSCDLRLLRRDGNSVDCHVILRSVHDAEGRLEYFVVMVQDISERKRLEDDLRLSATVFEHAAEGVIIVDRNIEIVAVNHTFTEITGYTEDEVIGLNPRLLQSGRTSPETYSEMWRSISERGFWRGELWNRRKDGELFAEQLTVSMVRNAQGELSHYVGLVSDITSIKRSQEQLDHQAHHDPLTGLPNRLLFEDRLSHALNRARREKQRLAVMFVDLDRFKIINDTLGHPVGDEVLRAIGNRLKQALRESDTVARLGGDEFILLLESVRDEADVAVVADKLIADLRQPIAAAGQDFFVTASIGASFYPRDGEDVATLVRNADAAMYRAKERGRNSYEFYHAELTALAQKRFALESELRRALDRGELRLHYQPQRTLADHALTGAEVLLRWTHAELGPISPAEFIPLAEESGLIVDIGRWVLDAACDQILAWRAVGLRPPPLAVNVSEVQMRRGDLVRQVEAVLARTGLPASCLELEITEGFIMHQSEERVAELTRLRQMGVGLAIDDFGTGYSSLSYLKRFPINKLKIDQSFVRGLPGDSDDAALCRAIIGMGRSLGLQIIAEGVELPAQQEFLRLAGCELMQGYLYARPMPADEFAEKILATAQPRRM